MNILVTIGPTQEPLDAMRILSNRSSGELGTQLALTLAQVGHRIIALRGTGATADQAELLRAGIEIIPFTTTEDLREAFEHISKNELIHAIFHAAAVSDFYFPKAGNGKLPTSSGPLTLTLNPTPKLLPLLRNWFPLSYITGWKFEASATRDEAILIAKAQIAKAQSNACVLNGPSYGEGFGYLDKEGAFQHFPDRTVLCSFLAAKLPA